MYIFTEILQIFVRLALFLRIREVIVESGASSTEAQLQGCSVRHFDRFSVHLCVAATSSVEENFGDREMAQHKEFATAGGEGERSYSQQSKLWNGLGAMLLPALKDTLLHHFTSAPHDAGPIHYADFGCAVGANTIGFAKFVIDTLQTKSELNGRDFVCHFADLPSNDFNTLFKQLPPIVGQGGGEGDGNTQERTWFADGVPGSQYDRMFPRSSLHVAIATLTLHYLPEVPKSIQDKSSPAYNKGRVSATGSNPAAAQAFAEASRKGLRRFFEYRAEEMVTGGILGFYCPGRRDRARPEKQMFDDSVHFFPGFERAWQELVHEGIIEEELLDSFNVPICHPSIDEIQEAIQHPTSEFHIQKLEFIDEFHIKPSNAEDTVFKDAETYGNTLTNMLISALGSMVTAHIGSKPTEVLVERFRHNSEKEYTSKKAAGFPMYMSFCVAVLIRK